jgi:hypothetical protein
MALLETVQSSRILRLGKNSRRPRLACREAVLSVGLDLLDDNVDALDHVVAHPLVSPGLFKGLDVALAVSRPDA